MKGRLGQLEQQVFAFVQLRKLRTLRTGDLFKIVPQLIEELKKRKGA